MDSLRIRPLVPSDADAYVALRRRGLSLEPEAFGSSLEDDHTADPEKVRATLAGEIPIWPFGAFDGESLVGTIALGRGTKIKTRHRGELYGTFVAPEARGRGAGAAMVEAALEKARELGLRCVGLTVAASADAARRLYERQGFAVWGRDPASLCIDDQLVGADAMIRWIDPVL